MFYASETFSGDDSVTALQHDIESINPSTMATTRSPLAVVDIESELTCLRSMFDAYAKGSMTASRDLAQHGPELLEHMRIKLQKAGRVMHNGVAHTLPESLGASTRAAIQELQTATYAVMSVMDQFRLLFAR